MDTATDRRFPLDWNEWARRYNTWCNAYGLKSTRKRIPGSNFMADEVMGTYVIRGHVVELSAVTFPDLGGGNSDRKNRYVGISWLGENGISLNGGLVDSFDELETALAAGPPAN